MCHFAVFWILMRRPNYGGIPFATDLQDSKESKDSKDCGQLFFLLLGNLYGWTAKVEHHLHWHDLLIVPVCPCVHCVYPFVFLLDILYFFLDVFHVSHQGPTNRLVRCPWPRGRQRGEGEGKVQERSEGVWEPFRGKSFHGN